MIVGGISNILFTPRNKLADNSERIFLSGDIPKKFSEYSSRGDSDGRVIDPVATNSIVQAYDDALSAVFRSQLGEEIFLAIAYGKNQREKKVHLPEGCYKSQGFSILSREIGVAIIETQKIIYGSFTALAASNYLEYVIYWISYSGISASPELGWRMTLFDMESNGLIPDGIVFRTSMLIQGNSNVERAEAKRKILKFHRGLFDAMSPLIRNRYFPTTTSKSK